jgi:hypothetical protein
MTAMVAAAAVLGREAQEALVLAAAAAAVVDCHRQRG